MIRLIFLLRLTLFPVEQIEERVGISRLILILRRNDALIGSNGLGWGDLLKPRCNRRNHTESNKSDDEHAKHQHNCLSIVLPIKKTTKELSPVPIL